MALQSPQQETVDVGFLQENNLTQGIHTQHGAGYDVWKMDAYSRHQGVFTVVWRAAKVWQGECMSIFGPNVVSVLLMLGAVLWYVV